MTAIRNVTTTGNPSLEDNLARVSLSASQQAALLGTAGTPGPSNKFVTDTDSRLGGSTGLPGLTLATSALVGDGTTDDAPALSTLVNTTLSGSGTIYFTPGKTYRLATAITVPLGITLTLPRGVTLQIDTAQVVISGTIDAGLWPVFSYVNGGTIVFSASNTQAGVALVLGNTEIYPQWWGATGSGTHDDTAALNAMIAATTGLPLTPVTTRRNAGPACRIPAGVYKVTDSIMAQDVTGLTMIGSGRDNTIIKVDDNWSGTSHAVTAATANTVSCSGTPFTTSHFNTGRWAVTISTGTGAGQWAIVSDNTTNQITTITNWTVTPDTSSVFFVCLVAGLDLDGVLAFSGTEFGVTATNANMRHGIKYYRDSTLSAGGSTQGRFTNVAVNRGYLDSAWKFGSKDRPSQTNWQSDLCVCVGCQAIGTGNANFTLRGFDCGDGSIDNVLNYTFLGCEAVSNGYGLFVNATNVTWIGGTIQSSFLADIGVNNSLQGYLVVQGTRSEGSRMWCDATGPLGSFTWSITFRDIDFFTDGIVGNRIMSFNLGTAAIALDGFRSVTDILTQGTVTSATSTTITDSGANFTTDVVTYADATTVTGHTGHLLSIKGGTGAGQSRFITSNTSTQITVSPAWDVTPDATSLYELTRVQQIVVESGINPFLDLSRVSLPGLLPHQFIVTGPAGGAWSARLRGCGGLDRDAALTGTSMVLQEGELWLSNSASNAPAFAFGVPGSTTALPDALLRRAGAGALGAPNFQTTSLTVAPLGTAPSGTATTAGAHTGTTQFNYKLVFRDGAGSPGLASATFSTPATCSPQSALGYDTAWIVVKLTGTTVPPLATTVDVLKDNGSGTFGIIGSVSASMFGQFIDFGQPIKTYTLPVADGTGTFAHAGTFGVFGATPIAKPSVTGSKGANAALTSLIAAFVSLGLVADNTT